jgi:hypothetical protein
MAAGADRRAPAWSNHDPVTRLLARVTRSSGRLHFRNDPVQAIGLRRPRRRERLVRLELFQPQQQLAEGDAIRPRQMFLVTLILVLLLD